MSHDADYRRSLPFVAMIALLWGVNWPLVKTAMLEMQPLTFRIVTIPVAGLGLLAIARLQGLSIAVPRRARTRLALLAALNITIWNLLVGFALITIEAGRAAILGYTMPVWSVLISTVILRDRLDRRRTIGLVLGMAAMTLLLAEDFRAIGRSPAGTLMMLAGAVSWALGIVLLRAWNLGMPTSVLSGWLMLYGSVPFAVLLPLFEHPLEHLAAASIAAWLAVAYNVVISGVLCHWAWVSLARRLPVAITSLSALPVPVVGVISGMLILGERPHLAEYAALALVALAMLALYWPRRGVAPASPVSR